LDSTHGYYGMDKSHYDGLIQQLRRDQQQIRAEADKEIADLEQAIVVLQKRASGSTSAKAPVKKPDANTMVVLPTDENTVVNALRILGGRGVVKQLFEVIERSGFEFKYDTKSQLHGFSIGLSKTRHTYKDIGYDANNKVYYLLGA
jgi:hypothetical protein